MFKFILEKVIMKKSIVILSMCLLIVYGGECQPLAAQDKLALDIAATSSSREITSYVKSHFASDSERARALFVWVANNISYDVEKLRSKIQGKASIDEVLKTRKAVCQAYAELLVELYNQCNIKSMLVPGYTKLPDGSIADLPHAWVAALVNNKWYLFDPTWAAGTVNNYQFTRRFSNRYYKVSPEEMIKDHMPFDPMYQFLNYPLMYNEFNRGAASINTSKPLFNYTDSINAYNAMDTLNQSISAARRMNRNGDKNKMVYELVEILNKNQRAGESGMGYNGAVAQLNHATDLFNIYIDHKNKRFSSIKDDKQVQQMIDSVLQYIKTAYAMLAPVVADNNEHKQLLATINNGLLRLYRRADDEKIFLKRYLQTDKALRR